MVRPGIRKSQLGDNQLFIRSMGTTFKPRATSVEIRGTSFVNNSTGYPRQMEMGVMVGGESGGCWDTRGSAKSKSRDLPGLARGPSSFSRWFNRRYTSVPYRSPYSGPFRDYFSRRLLIYIQRVRSPLKARRVAVGD